MTEILYAEDEMALAVAVTEMLRMEGYDVFHVENGRKAWEALQEKNFDIVILDIMMPELSGIEVLENMRKAQMFNPVLLLTAKAEVDDRIAGLSSGADDYLGKPFVIAELIAHIKALERRNMQYRSVELKYGNITLDCDSNRLSTEVGELFISSKETELLMLFMQNTGVSFGAEDIRNKLWREDEEEGIEQLYISYLLNKLKQLHSNVTLLEENGKYRIKVVDTQ